MSTPDLVNRETGKPITPQEWEQLKARCIQIFRDPYAAPELVDKAMELYPEGFAEAFEFRPAQEVRQGQLHK